MTTVALRDGIHRVVGEFFERVDENRRTEVNGDMDISVGPRSTLMTNANLLQTPKNFQKHPYDYEIYRRHWEPPTGAFRVQAASAISLIAGHDFSANAGGSLDIQATAHLDLLSGRRLTLKSQRMTNITSGDRIIVTADSDIRIGNAGGYIKTDKKGNITIRGRTLSVKTTGSTKVKASKIDLN
ncbi:hypothetical protein [Fulvimarina sp. MAC3]|uniref:hypothetical protein n=1 Tax=Fulvimarina sp. MAC3 TaxID=3148887 RepID=UPI0031FDE202